MVREEQIERVLQNIDEAEKGVNEILAKHQSAATNFFVHLSTEAYILSDEEKDYLSGMIAVILESSGFNSSKIQGNDWSEIEDQNWSEFENFRSLKDYFDVVFKDYPEEDLLAYIEDSLAEEEEDFISNAGREYILIKTKTLVDIIIYYAGLEQ